MEDAVLIAKILARDKHALHRFYRSNVSKLSRFIRQKIDNPSDAEEVLQDTLYAFLEAIRDFHGKSRIETFLYAICQHKIIDYYRRKKLRHIVFSQVPQIEDLISPVLNPEEELDVTLVKEKIQQAFGAVGNQYRQILSFKYLDNMSVYEIAETLAVSFKSAESLLFRARRAFVKAFVAM